MEEPIIKSILDNDLYKFSMQNAILEIFPKDKAHYKFKNRGNHKFNKFFLSTLKKQINLMSNLKLSDNEYLWIKENIPFLKPQYFEYLKNYRYNPSQIKVNLDKNDNLRLDIKGYWKDSILWEVPLMSLISELYFKIIDNNWEYNEKYIKNKARDKIIKLYGDECCFSEFGTRRRRSFEVQDKINCVFNQIREKIKEKYYVGTSNVYFAMKYGTTPKGSVAHEFIQGMQALESINHCNYYAMQNWIRVYNTKLGTFLPDTITTNMFLQNFNRRFAMMFDSLRHDSGDPYKFVDKIINKYKELNIDPMSKTIIFSDSLNIEKVLKIKKYCKDKIKCAFGIGTYFTNDFENSPPLNMVIKLWSINNFPVVKLSDVEGKENGDIKAISNMKWIIKQHLKRK